MINNKKLHGAQNSIYSHLIKKKNPAESQKIITCIK